MSYLTLITSFFKGGKAWQIYAFLVLIIALCLFFFLWQNQKLENENLKLSLNTAITANQELDKAFVELKARHERELKALSEVKISEDKIKEKIRVVDKVIYKRIEQGQKDIVLLFQVLVDELHKE